jgi:Cu-Zn family superoxide dismutase
MPQAEEPNMKYFDTARLILLSTSLLALGCQEDSDESKDGQFARAPLTTEAGAPAGEVIFIPRGGAVEVWASVSGLSPGFHGFHIHGHGACTPDHGAAGGHLDPSSATHPNHAGDMPPLLARADGTAELRFLTDRISLDTLLGGAGTAIIVHQSPDNLGNIPERYAATGADEATQGTGDAGARFACGVVEAATSVAAPQLGSPVARAEVRSMEGNVLGQVTFAPKNGAVEVSATLSGLPAGFHGFHVHGHGACTPDHGAAGGHLSAADAGHPNHLGDMPALLALQSGQAKLSFLTDRFAVSDTPPALLGGEGTAIILHADPDNYANIPTRYAPDGPDEATLATGDAGARLGCGVVVAM